MAGTETLNEREGERHREVAQTDRQTDGDSNTQYTGTQLHGKVYHGIYVVF